MARISEAEALRMGIRIATATAAGRPSHVARIRAAKPARVRPVDSGARRRAVDGPAFERIAFRLDAEPVTKARARTHLPKAAVSKAFARAAGDAEAFERFMAQVRHRSYTPEATAAFEALVSRMAAATMRSRPPVDAPVHVEVAFVFEGDATTWPTDVNDPDVDNAAKAVLDAAKGILWTDDRLVVRLTTVKACGPASAVHVRVSPPSRFDPVAEGWCLG